MTTAILTWILYYCSIYKVDPVLVRSMIQVESSGDSSKVGDLGEIGLLQLRPEYFGKGLKDPKHNIEAGVKHLAYLQDHCIHKTDETFIICYNVGIAGAKKIKNPKKFIYYKNVMKEYKRLVNE